MAAGCLVLGSTGGAVAEAMITGKQVKDGSLTGKDIKDKSLETVDLDPSVLTSAVKGAKGDPGTPGTPGAPGATGIVDFQTVATDPPLSLANGQTATDLVAVCPPGYQVLGGGLGSGSAASGLVVVQSRPFQAGPGTREWLIYVTNNSGSSQNVFAIATCAKFAT
jgi:hypothetical protein